MEACCGSLQATQSQGVSTFNHRYRQEGLTQTHRVFCACCTLYFALWLTYAGSSILDQETFRTAAYGLTTVTGLNWLVLLALYCSPTAKAHSDAVFTGTCAIMVSVATWTLPLTQQDAPKDVFDLVNRESGLLQATASPALYNLATALVLTYRPPPPAALPPPPLTGRPLVCQLRPGRDASNPMDPDPDPTDPDPNPAELALIPHGP